MKVYRLLYPKVTAKCHDGRHVITHVAEEGLDDFAEMYKLDLIFLCNNTSNTAIDKLLDNISTKRIAFLKGVGHNEW